MKRAIIIILTALLPSVAIAQPYYRPPPVEVYAQRPQPYYAPQPAYALGGLFGGLVSLPFEFLGGLFNAPQYPQVAMVPDGMGGWVPASNSRYDPVSGEFLPPGTPGGMPSGPYPSITPMPEPPTGYYDPPQRPQRRRPAKPADTPSHRGGCYDGTGKFVGGGNLECSG
jgi:hypothetical protein